MSVSVEGGVGIESGQDTEADSEPPHSAPVAPPECVGVEHGESLEEGGFAYAKRARLTDEELVFVDPADGQAPLAVEEDPVQPAPADPLRGQGDQEEKEVGVGGPEEKECPHNGVGVPDETPQQKEEQREEAPEGKPDDSPTEVVQQLALDFSRSPQYLTGSCAEYSHYPENYLKGVKW